MTLFDHDGGYFWTTRFLEEERRKKLPDSCKSAYKNYTGKRKPRCCGGTGCQRCWKIYDLKQ
jgi:hypothetical protein